MSKLGDFDINELILQLHSEMKLAFDIAQSAEQNYDLRIDTIKTRFGRNENGTTNTNTTSEKLEVLNGERYPNEENWEIEVNYKHGLPIPDIPQSQNWVASANSQHIIKKLGDVSLVHIKGVSTIWNIRFESAGISSIKDLASASASDILELCKHFNTLKPYEFQVKVLLLVRSFQPLRYDEFHDLSMNSLLLHTQKELKTMFRNKLSGPEISDLKAMASVIYLVFDQSFTNTLQLDILA